MEESSAGAKHSLEVTETPSSVIARGDREQQFWDSLPEFNMRVLAGAGIWGGSSLAVEPAT